MLPCPIDRNILLQKPQCLFALSSTHWPRLNVSIFGEAGKHRWAVSGDVDQFEYMDSVVSAADDV